MRLAVAAFSSLAVICAITLRAARSLPEETSDTQGPVAQLRRPVAMALGAGKLFVVNHRSGSISVLDPARGVVLCEAKVGNALSDLAYQPARKALLALDEKSGELIELDARQQTLQVRQRLAVSYSPVSLVVMKDRKACSIANLWAHRLTFVSIGDDPASLHITGTLDLPFAPRKQWLSDDGRTLVVADAFGGNLAVIDLPSRRLRAIRTFQGHNIGGLATTPDGKELVISHQLLNPNAPTDKDHVFWGQVMGSMLRNVKIDHLLNEDQSASGPALPSPIAHWSLYPIGGSQKGAGDLGEITFAPDGKEVVAVSGVNEVAVGHAPLDNFWHIPVGRNPTAVLMSEDGQAAYVANTLDDSISVVDLQRIEVSRTISLGPQPALSESDRGEILFHDATLCMSAWYSCNSCHIDGHTCGLLNDNHSDDSYATPKRVLSLRGVADTGPWAWNGRALALEAQVRSSLLSTMQAKPGDANDATVNAITAYLRTLSPAPGVAAARGEARSAAVKRGRLTFEALGCARCHRPPTYTSSKTYDVGLHDEAGESRFNPPSLRGISQLPAHFHDNRATSLRDVLVTHRHPDGEQIPPDRLKDLLEFLQSL